MADGSREYEVGGFSGGRRRWRWGWLLMTGAVTAVVVSGLRRLPLDPVQEHTLSALYVGRERFAHERRVHGARLLAKGSTHFHLFVIHVCSAVLYLEPHVDNSAVMTAVPKALEISYARSVSASDFRLSTVTLIERNGLLTPRIAAQCAEFNALYKDVSPGDRYLIEYHPRHAVSLRLNGKLLGQVGVRDAAFASALFSVWFGRQAFHSVFRDDLLRPIPALREEHKPLRWWRRARRALTRPLSCMRFRHL